MGMDREISEKRKRQCAKLVEISKDVVREAFEKFRPEELGITWTGGEDSGLVLGSSARSAKKRVYPSPMPRTGL